MENENIGAIELVSTEPTDLGAKEQEVTEPVTESETVVETEQEITQPARDKERDSWFAEKRRELEAKEKEMAKEYEAKLEAERQRIAELENKTKTYEQKEKYDGLRKQAEEYGLDYDELVAEVERQEALEAEKAKTTEELQREKDEKQKLAEEKQRLEEELLSLKMSMSDRDELLALDPTINLNELPEDFYKFRLSGYSPTKAYKLAQSLQDEVVLADAPGKVNSTKAESDTFSHEEWDSFSPQERERLMSTNFDKVYKSQMEWLRKK